MDLSETSTNAYDYATMLAKWYDAAITVVEMIWVGIPSVRPSTEPLVLTPQLLGDFTAELQQFVTDRTPLGIVATAVLREGPMVNGILDEAKQRAADLIVMGTHGLGGFDR